jgi:membrane-associated phospholipid phosphatase
LAELLNRSGAATFFWPVDKVILPYFAFTTAILIWSWRALPQAPQLFAVHAAATGLLIFEIKLPNRTSWVFRNWYPLLYVAFCYKEMATLIPAVWNFSAGHADADAWLASLDYRLWGAHPTVWIERFHTPALTEFLQVIYTLFIPAVLLVSFLLWRQRRYADFQYYGFLIALGYLVSYIGYLMVPARGPRFLLNSAQHFPLSGLWLFEYLQNGLDRLESAHFDCFPSGHTELTILAWWGSRMLSKSLFLLYFAYTPLLIFATVYLRYHYSVDLLAGMLVALLLIVSTPVLYTKLSKGAR